jgi:membrane-associated phospholipid phosphatase
MTPPLRFRDLVVAGTSILLLLLLARLVSGPEPPELDDEILTWLGAHIQGPIRLFLLQVYRMSGVGFTGMLVLAALVYLMLKRWWHDLVLLALATGGILAIVDIWLKPLFDRARPHAKLLVVDGRSFPSGHAAGSVAFYFAMVAILSLHYPRLRWPLTLAALAWVSLVWLSTLVARAHWPSDLLAGGAVGLAWLTICLAMWRGAWPPAHRQAH